MVINITLFNVKIHKLGTVQFLIYSDANSQSSRPITKTAQAEQHDTKSRQYKRQNRKYKTKGKYYN